MTDMWTALEKYQPFADKHGFGAAWKRMTTERTEGAAWVAAWAAEAKAWEAAVAAERVAWAAEAEDAEDAAAAIRYINEAIALEGSK
jgi:hypothetical protein